MDFINDIIQYQHLSNALFACILSGIACGIVGTYIVARRMVFLSGGITHSSFGGLGIALYANTNPIVGALLFAVAAALGIEGGKQNMGKLMGPVMAKVKGLADGNAVKKVVQEFLS